MFFTENIWEMFLSDTCQILSVNFLSDFLTWINIIFKMFPALEILYS